jgi:hypothetical protein
MASLPGLAGRRVVALIQALTHVCRAGGPARFGSSPDSR